MNRRAFVTMAGGTGLGLGLSKFWPDEGISNPCLSGLPRELAQHELVRATWEGIDPARVWDMHVHLLGNGDSGSGIWVSPQLRSPAHPLQYIQRLFYLDASCVNQAPGQVDQSYVARMHDLLAAMPQGVKLLLFAFDRSYSDDGRVLLDRTSFQIPDPYAARVALHDPSSFEWAASIHPYRRDCVEALEAAVARNARAVKWLPSAQGIDPSSPLCDRFYEALTRFNMPLISHAGEELAVLGGNEQHLGNPLLLRRALDHGVRVVVAHCASLGQSRDLDKGSNGPWLDSFDLFARMMDDARYSGRLFADISGITQRNRAGPVLGRIVEHTDWHPRLLNGSDYPLPGLMPLFSAEYLVDLGLLERHAAPVLSRLRKYNALLFDFAMKRQLSSGGKRFPASVFETRGFFSKAT